jgi:hypothetical protein
MGEFWRLAYHPDVLEALCRLRTGLHARRVPAAAALLGALHGPRNKPTVGASCSGGRPRRTPTAAASWAP